MSDRGHLIVTLDNGIKIYENGLLNSRGFFELNIGVYNVNAEFNPNSGDWTILDDGASIELGSDVQFSSEGDKVSMKIGRKYLKVVDVGIVITENGKVHPFLGLGVGNDLFGVGVGYIFADNQSNLSTYDTITVFPGGLIYETVHTPGTAEHPYVKTTTIVTNPDGSPPDTYYGNIGDPLLAADMAAGIAPRANGHCFLAGTMIDMWPLEADLKPDVDGNYDEEKVLAIAWKKPIEQIAQNNIVVSPDEDGRLKPGRVTRTSQNQTKYILNFHSLMTTPGHAFFCAEGKFKDRYVSIMDILRSDGCVQKVDGTIVRANINRKMGSIEDRHVWVVVGFEREGKFCLTEKGRVRLGTRMILEDGRDVSLFEHYTNIHGVVDEDGFFNDGASILNKVFQWPFGNSLPKPEDYVMQRSQISAQDIYQHGEWEPAFPPQMPAPYVEDAGRSLESDEGVSVMAPL